MEDQLKYLIPLQFTGLKDKNGKEIYEGDVIANKPETYPKAALDNIIVEWQHAGFNIHVHTHERWEVIGNIYQNPELLK